MKTFAAIALFIFCVFVLSCAKKTTEPDPVVPAKLCGRVTHAVYGYPLNQTWIGTTPYFDNGGPFGLNTFIDGKFCLYDMEPGPWEVRFYKLGYQTDTLQVTLAEAESLYVEVSLQRVIPDPGHGFYYAGFPFSETGNLDESSLVICTDYPDSLVISSQHGEWVGYFAIAASEFAAEIILRKPIFPGIIDLATGTAGYVRYRTWVWWYDDTISDISIGSTTQPGGEGQLQIYGYDSVNQTIEGIQSNVIFSYGTGYNTALNDCDFIGHW